MLEFESHDSILERLDPRTKILLVGVFSVGAILADSWISLLVLLLGVLTAWKMGKLSFRRHYVIAGIVVSSTVGVIITQSVFYTTSPSYIGEKTILFYLLPFDVPITGRLPVTVEGIRYGAFIAFRLAILILTAVLIPLTTHPSRFMISLVKLRIPFFIIMIITMSLRFIPLVQGNLLQLMEAQRVRGIKRASVKGMATLLSALLITTLRTAGELALSLETRAFRPFEKRTFYRDTYVTIYDAITLGVSSSVVMVALLLF